MLPDDPRHGTTRGYHAGCHDACCRAAIARYEKQGKYARLHGGRAVPALGAQRRIHALMVLGWTTADIAVEAGWAHRHYVRRILVGQNGKPCRWLERKTHDRIAEVFERLAMRLPEPAPHRARTRTLALRRGYAPPLAWDDIDDPTETPRGVGHVELNQHDSRIWDDVDPVVVERILAGDWRLPCTRAEKRAVVARWTGDRNELERATGWNLRRYLVRDVA